MLGESLKESVLRCQLYVEVKLKQYLLLHVEYLLGCVHVATDVDVVLQERRVNLLVLGGDKHGRHCHQLYVSVAYLTAAQVPVNDVDCEEEALGKQFEVMMDLNEPVN